jgi:glucosamine-6-phosphate deaminase
MDIEVLGDKTVVGSRAADLVCNAVAANPRAILGLPTGATPIPMYDELNRRSESGSCDFAAASVYAIDEFCDSGRTTPGTNSAYYREHLRFKPRALHCPNPAAQEPDLHIRAFADAIHRAGGLDLCVLGIGTSGHIAFNEPGAARDSRARVVNLIEASRVAHGATFGTLDAVPARAMTLGIADLLAARSIIVLATGATKAAMVREAIEGTATADIPASWLQVHSDVRWLLDPAAASMLT